MRSVSDALDPRQFDGTVVAIATASSAAAVIPRGRRGRSLGGRRRIGTRVGSGRRIELRLGFGVVIRFGRRRGIIVGARISVVRRRGGISSARRFGTAVLRRQARAGAARRIGSLASGSAAGRTAGSGCASFRRGLSTRARSARRGIAARGTLILHATRERRSRTVLRRLAAAAAARKRAQRTGRERDDQAEQEQFQSFAHFPLSRRRSVDGIPFRRPHHSSRIPSLCNGSGAT